MAAFAKTVPAEAWAEPSALEGWTRKGVLAHLAGDTGKVSAAAMRSAMDPATPHPTYGENEHVLNAQDIQSCSEASIEDLIIEIETDCEVWLKLLSSFDEKTDRRWPGFPVSLREYLQLMLPHDRDHLADIRAGLA